MRFRRKWRYGAWLESRLAHLAGEFAGIVLIDVPEPNIALLTAALRDLESTGLRITVERSADPHTPESRKTVKLELVGADRPGIVRDVTRALTGLGVISKNSPAALKPRPFPARKCSRATARLRVPDDLASEDLRKTLERLAGEIMVDLTVTPYESSDRPNPAAANKGERDAGENDEQGPPGPNGS